MSFTKICFVYNFILFDYATALLDCYISETPALSVKEFHTYTSLVH